MIELLLGKFLKRMSYSLGKYYTKKRSAKGIQYVMLRIKDVCKLMIWQAVGKRRSQAETKRCAPHTRVSSTWPAGTLRRGPFSVVNL